MFPVHLVHFSLNLQGLTVLAIVETSFTIFPELTLGLILRVIFCLQNPLLDSSYSLHCALRTPDIPQNKSGAPTNAVDMSSVEVDGDGGSGLYPGSKLGYVIEEQWYFTRTHTIPKTITLNSTRIMSKISLFFKCYYGRDACIFSEVINVRSPRSYPKHDSWNI